MSSHHIVRENQEPALLILNSRAISLKFVEQLLEWSPTIIAAETAINDVLHWGIKIDVATVSNTYLAPDELLNQHPMLMIRYNSNPLQAALTYLSHKSVTALNVMTFDVTDLDSIAGFSIPIDIVAFVNQVRYSLIRGRQYKKWLVKGTQLYIHPKIVFSSAGLTQQLQVSTTGFVKISSNSHFWVGELFV